jgi:hypothetical protein
MLIIFAWHVKYFLISVQLRKKGECRECPCFALANYKLIINAKMSHKMLYDSQLYDYMWFDFKTMFDQVAKTLHM